ncbi:hypothetical protein JCGZ_02461 [Jatropha curcas]|uniref:Uncharacterized protein n=1 Tax=Jatropha curcas TaxID=180498 RepID=A0A067JFU3_JATCU|nr:hypothetical protein JCGZ_02461 [Jatropha curcas]
MELKGARSTTKETHRAERYGAAMSLYIQEQVTQELHNLAFNKCRVELEGTPKLLTLLEANVGLPKDKLRGVVQN